MQFNSDIQIRESDKDSLPAPPTIQFRFEYSSALCTYEGEIDGQVEQLINHVKQLGKDAKIKLKNSIKKHDDLYKKTQKTESKGSE